MKKPVTTSTASGGWEQYVAPALGKKIAKRFAKCIANPLNEFNKRVIRPQLFSGTAYIPVTDNPKTPGRNHDWAELIANHPEIGEAHGVDALSAMTLFANQLLIARPTIDDDGSVEYEAPSLRVDHGRYLVLTLEYDVLDRQFLADQISSVMYVKNKLECPMGQFYKACSKFSDFAGITVVYGGNKSLHIHVVFDTTLAHEMFAIGNRSSCELRRGYMLLWDRIRKLFEDMIDTGGHSADRNLRAPEAYRRLPWGTRVAGENHLLGIPKGMEVIQVPIWEMFRDRSGGDAMFITPDAFTPEADIESKKLRRYRAGRTGPMTAAQVRYCEDRLRKMFPAWPRFSHLEAKGDRYEARFFNSPTDRRPSSVLKEDYRTICLVGTDAEQVTSPTLPMSFGDMLRMFREQMPGGARAPRDEADLNEEMKFVRALEDRFSTNVIDKASAYREMESFLMETVAELPLMKVVGPEGASKTTTLMRDFPIFAQRMRDRGDSEQGMFAFADYSAAAEKCEKFNDLQAGGRFIGVVLPSLTRLYKEARDDLKLPEITREEAVLGGYHDLLAAITALQPQVIDFFQERHEKLWSSIGNKTPVFFVVHQTMHLWKTNSLSRLMWARSFYTSRQDPDERSAVLRQETVIGIAVHDEVKTEHIVEMWQIEVIRWVKKVVGRKPWREASRDLAQCLKSFERFVAAKGFPIVRGQTVSISFDDVRRIESWLKTDPDPIVARDSGEYQMKTLSKDEDGEEQINAYEAAHGAEWRVGEQDWWNGLAHHVILLTTEKVPTALIGATTSAWSIFELRAPKMPKDVVQTYPQRSITGEKLPEVCASFRNLHPDTFIISNKVKMVVNSMPHVTARGSNDMIGKDVMQTMTYMTPSQYERLQVLNAWTGRSDLVGLHHIDEFNQTAGRNLGFRYQEGVTHTLLINRSLFRLLTTSGALSHSRYVWQPHLDKDQRHAAKKSSGTSSPKLS